MNENLDHTYLRKLGLGTPITSLCQQNNWSQDTFQQWWQAQLVSRLPDYRRSLQANVQAPVEIQRDQWGIPHIFADHDQDLFLGFGFALAQDRLFQLDYLRRQARGQLAEILGPEGLDSDRVARTVDLPGIAQREWDLLDHETRVVLESFSDGINLALSQSTALPIECSLLDYRPTPWTPVDSLAVECHFRWYLTGRFPVIVAPELAKQTLGTGPRLKQFLLGEADEESIMPPGSYRSSSPLHNSPGGTCSSEFEGHGSNNWAIDGSRSATGLPLVASDPHIAFEAVSCWYEVHLQGDTFDVAGMAYVGMPAVMFGRNQHVGWSITNNICSQRDLYQERTCDDHPGCFLYDNQWEPATRREETILVRDADAVRFDVSSSRNGPIVDDILPTAAPAGSPVSLKWLGASEGGWLTALLAMGRTNGVSAFLDAVEPWFVPTFSLVVADTAGAIGYQAAGRIPIRHQPERGYRPGWDPAHQWDGLIPFDGMPRLHNPERGWIASANNRLAPADYPYPLSGCWSSGHRAVRIRQMIEATSKHDTASFQQMQQDTLSLRATQALPALIPVLEHGNHPLLTEAMAILRKWDGRIDREAIGPTLFNTFFTNWCERVTAEHFDETMTPFMSSSASGIASRLLHEDNCQWFPSDCREKEIRGVFYRTLDQLAKQLGNEMNQWQWGHLQVIQFQHVLAGRGDLSQLLNQAPQAVSGDMTTVCNTGFATTGAGYRLIHDLGTEPPEMLAVDCQSQSGQPGSPHYADQFPVWASGDHHRILLTRMPPEESQATCLTLSPEPVSPPP